MCTHVYSLQHNYKKAAQYLWTSFLCLMLILSFIDLIQEIDYMKLSLIKNEVVECDLGLPLQWINIM
jgi:hypothetical protein